MSDDPGEAAARRLRTFAAAYVMFLGSVGVLLAWVAVSTAYLNGTWRVTLAFDRLGEGPLELLLLTGIVTLLPLGWMAFHETIRQR
jgi:hypothetical protein